MSEETSFYLVFLMYSIFYELIGAALVCFMSLMALCFDRGLYLDPHSGPWWHGAMVWGSWLFWPITIPILIFLFVFKRN